MSNKPGERKDDLAEFKELIGTEPVDSGEDISFDSIMAEYKYESVTKRKRKAAPDPMGGDTARLMKVADEMKKFAEDAESMRPEPSAADTVGQKAEEDSEAEAPVRLSRVKRDRGGFEEPSEPQIEEVFFGQPEDFQKAFAPSEDFVRDEGDAGEEEPIKPPRPRKSFFKAFRRFVKRKAESEETTPEQACARLTSYVAALRLRTVLAFFLLVPLIYITLSQSYGWPAPGFLSYFQHPYTYLMVTTFIQLLIMLCGLDVVARGFSDMFHLRPGMETLISVSCVTSILHVLSIAAVDSSAVYLEDGTAVMEGFVGFLPYNAVAAASVFFGLVGHYTLLGARRRTYKVASVKSAHDVVILEDRLWDDLSGFARIRGGAVDGFVARTEQPDMAQRVMSFITPLFLIAPLVLAFMLSVGKGMGERFFWAWAALSASAAPFGMMLIVALPFSKVTKRLEHMGAAIAGWSAAKSFSEGVFAVVGDDDLFPGDMITLNGLKVFGRYSYEKVTSMAASLMAVSGSGMYRALRSVSGLPEGSLKRVYSFEHYEGGGVGGEVDGDRVLMGSSAFMLRMGIRLSSELNIKNAVFVAVNMDIAGIFAINYIPDEDVEGSLHLMERQSITIVLAVRDFNISPLMLKRLFGIDSDQLEYPPVEDRLALSDPDRDTAAKPSAILSREGLTPYAESIVGGMRFYRISKINLIITIIGALGGLFLSFLLAYIGTTSSVLSLGPQNMLVYMLLWCLPVFAVSLTASRY